MRRKRMIGLGLAAIFISCLFLIGGVQAESLFKDLLKATGSVYKFTGETMDNLSKGREDSLVGKGLKIGGKVNKAVGSAVEEAGEEWPKNKNPETK